MFLRAITAVLLVALPLCAQTSAPQEPASAEHVLAQARRIYTEQGPKDALPEFELALKLFRQAGDRRGEAITLGNIGNCYKRLGDYPRALGFHQQALQLKLELHDRLEEGKTLSHLGLVYWEMADYPRAIEFLTQAIAVARELKHAQLEAAGLNNLSLVYDEQGDYGKSLEQYQLALQLQRSTGSEQDESYTLGNIGGVHLLLGHYAEALRYYQQSLAISERLKLKQGASLDLGNIGLCYVGLGRIPDALASFERALALATEAGMKKEEADWRKGKASALMRAGQYNKATAEYSLALKVYETAGLKRELTEALSDRGTLYLLLGDVAAAEKDFRQATEISRSIGHARGVTLNLMRLADIEFRRSRYEQAGALYREAVERARAARDLSSTVPALSQLALTQVRQQRYREAASSAQEAEEAARTTTSDWLLGQALYALGETARAAGEYQTALQHLASVQELAAKLGNPELDWQLAYAQGQSLEALERNEEAVAAYRRAISTIESIRAQLGEERFRAGYIEDKYQVYTALVRLLLKLGRVGDAFQAAEKLRACSYRDLLNRGLAPLRDESERQKESALRERIRLLQRKIEEESRRSASRQRGQAVKLFSAELAAAEREYQNLIDDLRRTESGYAAVRTLSVPSPADVQQNLPPDTALIEYLVGEDSLAVFVVTHNQLQARTVALPGSTFSARVELLHDLIVRPRSDAWVLPAAALRGLLVEPLEREGWLTGITKLLLVPHGVLHYVPFAALPQVGNGRPHYLIEDYELTYLPAAAALASVPQGSQYRKLMALAPARTGLRFAAEEAHAIAAYQPSRSLVLVGSAATETAFKQRGGEYGVVHFATHGYFNKLNPLFSGVDLEAGGGEDGRLEVHEILGMRLNADLVTLSACETAVGSGYFAEVPAGDDLVGLTRAFLFAGSPSVLATLWPVHDRSTLQLMRGFYSTLGRTTKAAALAKTQRRLIHTQGAYRHPYYWAPFVLVGRPE